MKDDVRDELQRLSLRRELSVDDEVRIEAALAAHPELREEWEKDRALGQVLRNMTDVPLASNFTAGVLTAIEREERRTAREAEGHGGWGRMKRWLQPRVSWAVVAALAAGIAAMQFKSAKKREMVVDVRGVARELATLPDPQVLQDFDAINQFRQVSYVSDDELLRALQ